MFQWRYDSIIWSGPWGNNTDSISRAALLNYSDHLVLTIWVFFSKLIIMQAKLIGMCAPIMIRAAKEVVSDDSFTWWPTPCKKFKISLDPFKRSCWS